LFWKKQAENYLIDSGLTYTIIRPGGLRNEDSQYSLIVGEADTLFEGSISRQEVAKLITPLVKTKWILSGCYAMG
ncbi:hypothetical protein FLX56_28755, partial [Synechococcus moorigangaii CMS01]|nr:hypothetical protein [Synechococcus moorigangaii CMS01]